MKTHATRIGILLVIGLIATSGLAVADGQVAPLGVIPEPTPQPLTVNLWTDKSTYMVGETLTIFFSVSQAAFIYIYDIQPDGIVRLIFPNAYSQGNLVSAGTHTLPDGLYKFTVAPPTGLEQLQIFASPVDLGLAPPYFGEPYPMAGGSPGAATSQIQAQIMGIVPEPVWATAWTSFVITQHYGYTPPSQGYVPPSQGYVPPSQGYYGQGYWHPTSSYQPPPFVGSHGAIWFFFGGHWHSGMPTSGPYWYWYNPCGYAYPACGEWRIRFRICIGCGTP